MRRRRFIAGLGVAAAWPLAARAQLRGGVRRIGVLMNSVATDTEFQSYVAVFIQGLRQLGWLESQNLRVDVRWNAGNAGLSPAEQSAISALQACQPYAMLPPERYGEWKVLDLSFSPRDFNS